MSNIPEQITAFRIYANGNDLIGIASVELPELSNQTETISGTGILGEYESPSVGDFQSMSVKLKWNGHTEKATSVLNPLLPLQLECRASEQQADMQTGAKKSIPIEITVFGTAKGAGLGSFETSKKTDNETEIEITRLVHSVNGKQKLLIDKTNLIYAIDGVDIMAPIRANLGLAY